MAASTGRHLCRRFFSQEFGSERSSAVGRIRRLVVRHFLRLVDRLLDVMAFNASDWSNALDVVVLCGVVEMAESHFSQHRFF